MYPCAEAVTTESADTLEQLEQPGEQLPAELLQVQKTNLSVATTASASRVLLRLRVRVGSYIVASSSYVGFLAEFT